MNIRRNKLVKHFFEFSVILFNVFFHRLHFLFGIHFGFKIICLHKSLPFVKI